MSQEKGPSKRQALREKRQRSQRNSRLIAIGLMTLGALFIGFLLISSTLRTNAEFSARPNAVDNSMGDPRAPLTVTEFSDYRCSHCGTFALEIEPLIVEEYVETGLVRFVYRSMGGWLSEQSGYAAEASYCAGEQGKFWEYHDIVFANQGANLDLANLTAWAGIVGVDQGEFRECMQQRRYQERADQDAADGTALGVQGTPTFFVTYTVDGEERTRVIQGAQPYSAFQREFDAALAEMSLE